MFDVDQWLYSFTSFVAYAGDCYPFNHVVTPWCAHQSIQFMHVVRCANTSIVSLLVICNELIYRCKMSFSFCVLLGLTVHTYTCAYVATFEWSCDFLMSATAQLSGGGFLSELSGIQQFIESQSRISSVVDLQQSQCNSLAHRISILPKFDVGLATSMSTLIQAGPWTASQKDVLASAIQSRLLKDQSDSPDGRHRRRNQQLKNFERYLTDSELALLQDVHCSEHLKYIRWMWFVVCWSRHVWNHIPWYR